MKTTMLEEGDGGASKLCPKADVVIAKLDTLYNKLDNAAIEDTDEKRAAKTKMEDDHQAYLDCESEADLAKKEKDEAKQGADYATDQYNNYKDTVDQAETDLIKIRKDTADKIATLNGEDEMIRKILSMLGMIEEVGPSAKGIAAGGRVVEPAQAKAINKQIANLKQAASKMGGVQMQQAARLSNLMAYQETDEVKDILLKMLEDIQTQVDTTNSLLTEAEGDLADQKVTLNGYQQTMVNLNAKHDQAAGALIAANQKRAVSSLPPQSTPLPSPSLPRSPPLPPASSPSHSRGRFAPRTWVCWCRIKKLAGRRPGPRRLSPAQGLPGRLTCGATASWVTFSSVTRAVRKGGGLVAAVVCVCRARPSSLACPHSRGGCP